MDLIQHQLMVWIISISIIILGIFTISTLITYTKVKNRTAIYLTMNYIGFILNNILYLVGHLNSLMVGSTTDFYSQASMIGNLFIVIGILFILLFHATFTEVSKIWKYIRILLGIALMIWILLPLNYTEATPGKFQIKYLTYLFMAIYGISVNLFLTISFFKLARKVALKKEMRDLGIGSLAFLIYYILMMVYGISQNLIFVIISQIDVFIALLFYFLGIYLPKYRSHSS